MCQTHEEGTTLVEFLDHQGQTICVLWKNQPFLEGTEKQNPADVPGIDANLLRTTKLTSRKQSGGNPQAVFIRGGGQGTAPTALPPLLRGTWASARITRLLRGEVGGHELTC